MTLVSKNMRPVSGSRERGSEPFELLVRLLGAEPSTEFCKIVIKFLIKLDIGNTVANNDYNKK